MIYPRYMLKYIKAKDTGYTAALSVRRRTYLSIILLRGKTGNLLLLSQWELWQVKCLGHGG